MANVGTGATITFGTSGWAGKITAINGGEASRAVIDTSHLGTTGGRTKIPGKLVDYTEVELEIQFEPNIPPPITGDAETITIVLPDDGGSPTNSTLTGTGFVSSWSWGNPLEELRTGSITITWSSAPAWS